MTSPHRGRLRLLLLAGVVLLVDLLLLAVTVPDATITYSLPSHRPEVTYANTVVWAPGLAAALFTAVAAAAAAAWLAVTLVGRPPLDGRRRRWWLLPIGLSALALLGTVTVSQLAMPSF